MPAEQVVIYKVCIEDGKPVVRAFKGKRGTHMTTATQKRLRAFTLHEDEVEAYVNAKGAVKAGDVSKALGVKSDLAREFLARLVRQGKITKDTTEIGVFRKLADAVELQHSENHTID